MIQKYDPYELVRDTWSRTILIGFIDPILGLIAPIYTGRLLVLENNLFPEVRSFESLTEAGYGVWSTMRSLFGLGLECQLREI